MASESISDKRRGSDNRPRCKHLLREGQVQDGHQVSPSTHWGKGRYRMAIKYHRALNGGRGGTGWPSSITEHSLGEGEVQDGHQVSPSTHWGKGRYRMAIKYH